MENLFETYWTSLGVPQLETNKLGISSLESNTARISLNMKQWTPRRTSSMLQCGTKRLYFLYPLWHTPLYIPHLDIPPTPMDIYRIPYFWQNVCIEETCRIWTYEASWYWERPRVKAMDNYETLLYKDPRDLKLIISKWVDGVQSLKLWKISLKLIGRA